LLTIETSTHFFQRLDPATEKPIKVMILDGNFWLPSGETGADGVCADIMVLYVGHMLME
jgi:hypothetical protein